MKVCLRLLAFKNASKKQKRWPRIRKMLLTNRTLYISKSSRLSSTEDCKSDSSRKSWGFQFRNSSNIQSKRGKKRGLVLIHRSDSFKSFFFHTSINLTRVWDFDILLFAFLFLSPFSLRFCYFASYYWRLTAIFYFSIPSHFLLYLVFIGRMFSFAETCHTSRSKTFTNILLNSLFFAFITFAKGSSRLIRFELASSFRLTITRCLRALELRFDFLRDIFLRVSYF